MIYQRFSAKVRYNIEIYKHFVSFFAIFEFGFEMGNQIDEVAIITVGLNFLGVPPPLHLETRILLPVSTSIIFKESLAQIKRYALVYFMISKSWTLDYP